MHRNNILIYIQQDATLRSLFYLETALHVSGGTTHPPSEAQTAVSTASGLRHPQHTQTSSTSTTIAADSSNGVKNNRPRTQHGYYHDTKVKPEVATAVI